MTESTTRLHITPLNPDLLPSVLPPSVRPSATDISFHSLPTFPENNYGYITLPTMEAEKIQKKLNGKILKGKKFKIETARPSKRQRHEEEIADEPPAEKKKSKKSKPEDGVLEGFELPADRKVKRGWTESSKKDKHRSDKKKSKNDKKEKPQPKSKYTDKSELLFRTNLPPNRAAEESEDKKAKKKKKSSKETIVAGTKEKRSAKKSKVPESKPESSSESEDWTSSSGSSDESSDSDSDDDSSGDSSDDSAMEEAPTDQEPPKTTPSKATPPTSEDSDSDSNSESESQSVNKQEEKTEEPVSQEVHPLEALFKRPAPNAEQQPAEDTNAGFSFFGNGDIESEDETQSVAPQTPFTKRDLQDRGLRSAAPTPDTTMINRRINWNEEDGMDDDASIDTPVSKSRNSTVDAKDDTEFTKWFWENRGDNNRAWKKRRRDAAKEQRQRENRKKGMKGRS
ncbi:hypothetical protein N7450_001052 [Penicillium hetheringtonii]|uniref:Suppressor protein SRP40 n=1 Tax=Penicillium hetheringtonii TaxID=911720 RepID=A0AAD6H364_9EURO|nr:hypothetical protein N7450_001052 [Penicillium hetheringtonii]